MTSYTARNWIVRDLPFGTLDGYPLVEADIPNAHIVTMVSPAADALDSHGVTNVFYTDLEQEVAGLDTNYGSTGLKAAAEDFVLPDGTEIKVGALVFTVTRMDMEAGTMTTLFEKL
jgi:hypothetical protein